MGEDSFDLVLVFRVGPFGISITFHERDHEDLSSANSNQAFRTFNYRDHDFGAAVLLTKLKSKTRFVGISFPLSPRLF
jgi:hypothetical protein